MVECHHFWLTCGEPLQSRGTRSDFKYGCQVAIREKNKVLLLLRSHTTVFLKRPGCVNVATEDVPTSFRWLIAGVHLSERADVIYH
jgi:tRNA splicing endonuclease